MDDDTNAFAEYACHLVDDDDEDDSGCFVIDIDYSYVNKGLDCRAYRNQYDVVRRGNEDDWIASLRGAQQEDARIAVEARCS
jgi:hypothetical protein